MVNVAPAQLKAALAMMFLVVSVVIGYVDVPILKYVLPVACALGVMQADLNTQ